MLIFIDFSFIFNENAIFSGWCLFYAASVESSSLCGTFYGGNAVACVADSIALGVTSSAVASTVVAAFVAIVDVAIVAIFAVAIVVVTIIPCQIDETQPIRVICIGPVQIFKTCHPKKCIYYVSD